jgi:pimeloyl-ACP methyl ester carboxylesterase
MCALLGGAAGAQESVPIKDGLGIHIPRAYQRSVLTIDPIEASIAAGRWKAPRAGDSVAFPSADPAKWEAVSAEADGWFGGPAAGDGYIFVRVPSETDRIMILDGLGDVYVYVNGQLRMGAKYGVKDRYEAWEPRFDYGQVPVFLKKGSNEFLFRCNRGRLKAVLTPPPAPAVLNEKDVTLPDLLVGEKIEAWAAIVVMNATDRVRKDLVLTVEGMGLTATTADVGTLLPFAVRKAVFRLEGAAPAQAGPITVTIALADKNQKGAVDRRGLSVEIKSPKQNHKRTFRSGVDGSVQYYAVNPAQGADPAFKPALVVSAHGASVEATNQAGSYESKSWATIVAPTNRRPYGFDWEDWGRVDALEAMADFAARYPYDPARVYLTGHSMGGHGAWILAATFPDRFAAVGPSAGWISFRTYASRQKDEGPSEIEKLTNRALLQGDTLALAGNLASLGVYILHGEKDDNVPVAQARQMAQTLAGFHKDYVYHEEKDAGHWWDKSDEPGADCVDWPPLFDFFARHALPSRSMVRDVEFATANPGVSAQFRWARIEAPIEPFKLSSVRLRVDPGLKKFSGTTQNVARLALDLSILEWSGGITIELDGQTIKAAPREPTLWLYRGGEVWAAGLRPSPSLKGPHRNGPFKDAFRNRVQFVYGTRGTTEENAWALGKARFDAELFQYQGNGSIEIVSDGDFRPEAEPDRNVILYGNASTNAAWKPLLGAGPVQIDRGVVRAGSRIIEGRDLACLFLLPRPGSDVACVGVVGGTGLQGFALTDTRPYLYSGYALPDLIVFGPDVTKGGGQGLKLAGFFGPDWGVESGTFVGN